MYKNLYWWCKYFVRPLVWAKCLWWHMGTISKNKWCRKSSWRILFGLYKSYISWSLLYSRIVLGFIFIESSPTNCFYYESFWLRSSKTKSKGKKKYVLQRTKEKSQNWFNPYLLKMKDFLDLTKDIWDFLRVRKKYWLAPLIITIVLMGALIVFTQGSVVTPFIYSIF